MKFGKAMGRGISIRPSSNNGFIAKIGCCTMVYKNAEDLLTDLEEYLKDPKAVEKEYNDADAKIPIRRDVEEQYEDDL